MSAPKSFIIIGAGPCGLSLAIQLTRLSYPVTIYELRNEPSTIGGAVNVTPNALNLLHHIGIDTSDLGCECPAIEIFSLQSGSRLGEVPFRSPAGPSRRIERKDLQAALLDAVSKTNANLVYGAKLVSIVDESSNQSATVRFEDGREDTADFIIGCDGAHSAVRALYVDPERKATYTGISVAHTTLETSSLNEPYHVECTAMNMGRKGSLLTSLCSADRSRLFIGAAMSMPEAKGREGWKALNNDKKTTMAEFKRRYSGSALKSINEMVTVIEKVDDLFFYPIFSLDNGGVWSKGRSLLLGDAAHVMPPQGESTGFAIEDSILFARVAESLQDRPVKEIFLCYEKTRRARITEGWKHANERFENLKDKNWLQQSVIEWFTGWYMWFSRDRWEKSMTYDVRNEELVL